MERSRVPRVVDFVAVPLLYYLGAKAGVYLTVMPEGMAILWPPNSVLLAALLAFRGRGFLPFALSTLGAEIAADLPRFRLDEAILFGLVNIAEASLVWGLLTRTRFDPRFTALRDSVKFVVAGPLIGAFLAACGGALVYTLYRGVDTGYLEFLRIWWFGDALGLMIFTPLLLGVWASPPPLPRAAPSLMDAGVSLAAVAAVWLLVTARNGLWLGMHVSPAILLPFVIYVAARASLVWSAAAAACVAVIVIAAMTGGLQPFGDLPARSAVIYAQELLFAMGLLALGLTALLSQIRVHEAEVLALNAGLEQKIEARTRELTEALAQVKQLRGLLPMCAWCKKIRDGDDYWYAVDTYITNHTDAKISHGLCPDCYGKVSREGL